jgi:serine protease Do
MQVRFTQWLLLVQLLSPLGQEALAASPSLRQKQSNVRQQRSEMARVARGALSSVVAITTRPKGVNALDAEGQRGFGAGFFVDPSGFLITSAHVVEDAADIQVAVRSPNGSTQSYTARLVGIDALTDCAVLKVDVPRAVPVLKMGHSRNVDIADWVVVIGNPFGLMHSVSVGVVSYKGRSEVTPAGRAGYFDYLQTDAAINPGNSGGPVLDLNGEVVAVANAVNVSGHGIGFAIPIETVRAVLPQLYAYGSVRHGWLGLTLSDSEGESGVLVSSVEKEGPAFKAGLSEGDVILGFNRMRVYRAHRLRWQLTTATVGQTIELLFLRDGRPRRARVRLTEPPSGGEKSGWATASGEAADAPTAQHRLTGECPVVSVPETSSHRLNHRHGVLRRLYGGATCSPGPPSEVNTRKRELEAEGREPPRPE